MSAHGFCCPYVDCVRCFETDAQKQGHIGGAHMRKRTTRLPIKHGTKNGYRQHQRHKVPACAHCRRAWRIYIASIRKKGKS